MFRSDGATAGSGNEVASGPVACCSLVRGPSRPKTSGGEEATAEGAEVSSQLSQVD